MLFICLWCYLVFTIYIFFCQAEDGILDLVRARELADVYMSQLLGRGEVGDA